MAPIRPRGSVQLDSGVLPVRRGETPGDPIGESIPFVPWREFLPRFDAQFQQGQHITLVGKNGSGKTILARHLILLRTYVVVFATKQRDPSLYEPLAKEGFEIVERFESEPLEHPRLILKPYLPDPSRKSVMMMGSVFEDALNEIWQVGDWCVFADEVRYLTDTLRLSTTLETLWLQGRSMGISIVAGTQRPVSVPREAFSQAKHFFFFAEHERDNVIRMSEFTGPDMDLVRFVLPRLPLHEALYVNTETGDLARTKVEL